MVAGRLGIGLFLLGVAAGAAVAQGPGSGMTPGSGAAPGGAPRASTRFAGRREALYLEPGSVARRQMVGVGRDVVVAGDALADVAALNGSVEVTGHVAGQVIVLGGNVHLGPHGRVDGDVFALGGRILADPGARLGGRSVSYPDASKAWLTMLEEPSLGLAVTSPLIVGVKLALLAAWAALLVILFAVAGREVLETAYEVRREPFRNFFVGLVAIIALLLTALFLSAVAGDLASVPLLVLLVLAATLLKLWGMVAVFYALGDFITSRLLGRRLRPLNAASLGLLLLGGLKFLPYVGVWTWTAASFIGVGSSLATKFGRQEPWFDFS
jgi:hypothetical protein